MCNRKFLSTSESSFSLGEGEHQTCATQSAKDSTTSAINAANSLFTITAEIHARSLVNFCQYAQRHVNLKFMQRVSEREREFRQFVIIKEHIDVSF